MKIMTKKKYNVIDTKQMKYWQDRAIIRDKKYIKDVKVIEAKLKLEFVKAKKAIQKEIDAFYANLDEVSLSEAEKNRLEDVVKAIDRELDSLFQKQEDMLTKALIAKYEETHKEVSRDLGISFSRIPENFIKEVIAQNWSGMTFSERIWEGQRKQLASQIKEQLKAGLIRGDSLQDIANIISKKLNSSYKNAFRLARTEMSYVINQATVNDYKANGITHYQFLAFIDSRTSEICRSRDGEVISVEEARVGSNLPPLRCCYTRIVEVQSFQLLIK